MRCGEMQELITALVDNELSDQERSIVESHLKDCLRCRSVFEHGEALQRAIRLAAVGLNTPTNLRTKILSDLRLFLDGGLTMDATSLKHYREKLAKRNEQILTAIRNVQKEYQDVAGKRHFDWLDQATDENEIRLLDRLNEGYLRELERIEMAQRRISLGSYGLCLGCHRPIEKARLEAFPKTEFCLECQDLREQFERAS